MKEFHKIARTVRVPYILALLVFFLDSAYADDVNDRLELNERLSKVISNSGVRTAAIGVIKNHELAWSSYYGLQSPEVPANKDTLFNVASIAKVFTTELTLKLVSLGKISLDESMSSHWVDPDIRSDERHKRLTPRMVLNHTTGFPNWRFERPDGRLSFETEPGVAYGYSGEGFQYLARFLEQKLGAGFEDLMQEYLLKPNGIQDAWFSPRSENHQSLAQPHNEDGLFIGHYCRPNGWCQREGVWSAADDLAITLTGLVTFTISSSLARGLSRKIIQDRKRILYDFGSSIVCAENTDAEKEQAACPLKAGFGLGWEVYDYGNDSVLAHGGNDWSEFAQVYFNPLTGDGVVVVLNALPESGLRAMVGILNEIDAESPLAQSHRKSFNDMTAELEQKRASLRRKGMNISELSDEQLTQLILDADRKLFDKGFNGCSFDHWNESLSADLEFYDDRTGLNRDRSKEVRMFKNKCAAKDKLTRKLIDSSVNRLGNYGAFQLGLHAFYLNERLVGKAKFANVWALGVGNRWEITRAISYAHESTTEKSAN